jgi:hypothetical protein
MRNVVVMIVVVSILGLVAHGQNSSASDCSTLNTVKGPFHYTKSDIQRKQHRSGNHDWNNATQGSCTYSGYAQVGYPTLCAVHSSAQSSSVALDNGVTAPFWHSPNQNDKGGIADGPNGGQATADAEGAAAVSSCAVFPCAGPSVTITGSGTGGGFGVQFASGGQIIFSDAQHYSNTCTAYTLQPLPGPSLCPNPNPPSPPYNEGQGGYYWYWDDQACQWENNGASPIIIDTKNTGFQFTDPTKGQYVSFDIEGHGVYLKVSWPQHGSGNAWLVLDRDGDGIIKDGTELFGDFTPHSSPEEVPNYPNPNGFVALSWYDEPAQGGDGNLILDNRDAIWPKLRLWLDDHCYKEPDKPCRSRREELHTLESEGIQSISLVWDASAKTDAVGNKFEFFTVLNPEAATTPRDAKGQRCCDLHQKSKDARLIYDVFLKTVN